MQIFFSQTLINSPVMKIKDDFCFAIHHVHTLIPEYIAINYTRFLPEWSI